MPPVRPPAALLDRAVAGRTAAVLLALAVTVAFGYEATQPSPRSATASLRRPAAATPSPTPTPTPTTTPTAVATTPPSGPRTTRPPSTPAGYTTWALIDRHTGAIRGLNVAKTAFSESTVKIWLAADFFNRARAAGQTISSTDMALLQKMIRFSDDAAADHFFSRNGGFASITRMIKTCGLGDTSPDPERQRWSKTLISARDLAKLGLCIANATAANPTDTAWILDQMRHVGGDGLFGIKFALPEPDASQLAIKNGWYNHGFDSTWRVLCLGVHADWVLAVESTYPSRLGRGYGEQACVDTTKLALGLGAPTANPTVSPSAPTP